jgi:polysaccharide biosynthesis protein PslJ
VTAVDEPPLSPRGPLPPTGGFRRQLHRMRRIDPVTALTLFIVLSCAIPSPLIVGPIGASGTPGNLLGLMFLLWWAAAKMGSDPDIARGRQPVRIALLFFYVPALFSMVTLYSRPYLGEENLGALRGMLYLTALLGVTLVGADGIMSIDRIHILMRRVVDGAAFIASLAVVQFVTGYNAAAQLSIPGLVRNSQLQSQDRSLFLRVQSTTIHPIELGALMGIMLPIALLYAFSAPPGRRRWVAWIEVGLIATVLPMALSRTGAIAAAIGLIALAMEWTWARRLRVIGIGLVFFGAMRVAIPGLLGTLLALFTKISEDNSTQGRTGRYEIAGHLFLQHPWFGRGFNSLYPATKQIFDNAYLYQATEQGIVGVVGLLLFFAIVMFTARGAHRRAKDAETKALAQALFGTALAMMVIFSTADIGGFTILMGMFFLMVGVVGALWRLTGGPTGPGPQPRALPRTRRAAGGA